MDCNYWGKMYFKNNINADGSAVNIKLNKNILKI